MISAPSQARQYQAGMRCPHQSCREMHHGLMFSIHCRYTEVERSGTIRTSPSRTTRAASAASSVVSTNHWFETSGSTTTPERCECATLWTCVSSLTR